MECAGHDVCINGNRPAQSKHSLLKTWPNFRVARDISSFLGFMNFYSSYIPYFEQRVAPLRLLAKLDCDTNVGPLMFDEHFKARKDMIMAILSNPCIVQFDYRKRPYLLTDFFELGFRYNLCQPANDAASQVAMQCEMNGGECKFLIPDSKLMLKSTGFGSRKTRRRKANLHSHLGEGFALDWAINQCRAKLWSVRFLPLLVVGPCSSY